MGGVFGTLMAEYVLAAIINWHRLTFVYYRQQQQRVWDSSIQMLSSSHLNSMTLGIVGFGNIGHEGKLLSFDVLCNLI